MEEQEVKNTLPIKFWRKVFPKNVSYFINMNSTATVN